jgi:hypothetical protein
MSTKIVTVTAEELEELVTRACSKALAGVKPIAGDSSHDRPDRPIVTVGDVQRLYGLGRPAIVAKIASGELPAVQRTMRGGRQGYVMRRSDCERVFAGTR